jgi:hypothetical protein
MKKSDEKKPGRKKKKGPGNTLKAFQISQFKKPVGEVFEFRIGGHPI